MVRQGSTKEAGVSRRTGRSGTGEGRDDGAVGLGGVQVGKTISSVWVCVGVREVLRGRSGGQAGGGMSDPFRYVQYPKRLEHCT